MSECISVANPSVTVEESVRKARVMIESLRKAGLDVVFLTWVDDPDSARGRSGGDPFDEMMRPFLDDLGDRRPWIPDGVEL